MDAMFNHKWPLCCGFYYKKLLFLSDGDDEDMPEYAVVAIDKTEGRFGICGREMGRIKPSRMLASDVPTYIEGLNAGYLNGGNPVEFVAEPKWHHSCELCQLEEG